jgi:hypothetical protein
MPRIKWNEQKIKEREREGFGQGVGADYLPWILVTDFSSAGRSRRVWSQKTNRTHQLFSDVEYDIFLALEWSEEVLDIREQFPLDREITQELARELRIKHPHYPGTQVPSVMTVDFLVTKNGRDGTYHVGLNAKRDEEAEDPRSLEKLEIQRSYFEAMGYEHHLVYHSQIPKQKIANIDWIRRALVKVGELESSPGFFDSLTQRMSKELSSNRDSSLLLTEYCSGFDGRHGVEIGTGLRIARMLMENRTIHVDLSSLNLTLEPMSSFMPTVRFGNLRAVGGA